MALSSIKINAKNDANGNPRRGWIILETNEDGYTSIKSFCDEGYNGSAAVTQQGFARELADTPEILTTPGEYRDLVRRFGRAAA